MRSKVTLELQRLQQIKKTLDAFKNARVQVGVWNTPRIQNSRDEGWKRTNPEIGLAMEYGEVRNKWGHPTPARSWLRFPLVTHLRDTMTEGGRKIFRAIILKDGLRMCLKALGIMAENTIQNAFSTGGWGRWQPLAARTVIRKGSSAILIDSAQLRRAVTSKVRQGRPTP